ncbi:putative protein ZNF720 [Suricata suricatta]|uniref:putative protein ZNF720 n=1 Tax=Suricata suricatta TaxID=37032 RepID=UPI0011559E08|nr:putative protein ZNF720 [Suricata suricatta]
MLETYGHLVFLGLVVSKPDLVIFLEQKRVLWDVKRKETVASYPAVFPNETDSLLSETFIGTSIQRVSVDGYKASQNSSWSNSSKFEEYEKSFVDCSPLASHWKLDTGE